MLQDALKGDDHQHNIHSMMTAPTSLPLRGGSHHGVFALLDNTTDLPPGN